MERWRWPDLGLRPVFFPAFSFVFGAALGPETGLGGGVFLAVAGGLWLAAGLRGARVGGHLLLLLAFAASGGALARLAMRTEVPPGVDERQVALEGRVERFDRFEDFTRIELSVTGAGTPLAPARFVARLSSTPAAPTLEIGQWVRLKARLKPLEGPDNPGEWDARRWRERRGLLFGGGFVAHSVVPISRAAPWRTWLRDTHGKMSQAVHSLAPTRSSGALYLTLAAGLRAALPEELEEAFARSGLAHVLSVSGLHVAALAVFLLKALRWLLVRLQRRPSTFDARRWAAPLSVPLLWAYVAFTGMQVPAVRSAIMASAVLLGLSLWRRADALNALALAALAIVAIEPPAVMDLSLQLSFAAVLSLIVLSPAIRQLLPLPPPGPESGWKRRALEVAAQTLCAGLAVTITSAPLLAGSFGRVSLAGLLANILCLPLSGLLTGLAAGGAALFVLHPPLSVPLLWAGSHASALLEWAATGFAELPLATLRAQPLGPALSIAFFAGVLAFALGVRRWRWTGVLAPAALCAPLLILAVRSPPPLIVTFLAVGQGDAVVVSSNGHHALIDGGGTPNGADTGKRFVLPFLRREGIERFDLAVLSHPHPDHALGMVSTLERVPTDRLWLAAETGGGALTQAVVAAARRGSFGTTEVREVELGSPGLSLGEAHLHVLGPPRDRLLLEGVNDRSVVLKLVHGEVTVLLTGDIEADGEEALLDELGPVTVMKAPHHGSRTSSTEAFLARTRPRHVVFCVGRANRFGFPHEDVVEAYRAAGARCHRTDLGGALRVESDGRDVRLVAFHPPEQREQQRAVARRRR